MERESWKQTFLGETRFSKHTREVDFAGAIIHPKLSGETPETLFAWSAELWQEFFDSQQRSIPPELVYGTYQKIFQNLVGYEFKEQVSMRKPLSFSTGGRKVAVLEPKFLDNCLNPFYLNLHRIVSTINPAFKRCYPDFFRVTFKGVGSTREPVNEDSFFARDSIEGHTGFDDREHTFNELLRGNHIIINENGEEFEYEYIPGRELIMAVPLSSIIFRHNSGLVYETIDLNNINRQMPLATGENRLHILMYVEYTPDLENMVIRKNNRIENVGDLQKYIHDTLKSHPHFAEYLSDSEPPDNYQLLKMMIRKIFYDAQVEHRLVHWGYNRSQQNQLLDMTYTDFDDSKLRPQPLTIFNFYNGFINVLKSKVKNLENIFPKNTFSKPDFLQAILMKSTSKYVEFMVKNYSENGEVSLDDILNFVEDLIQHDLQIAYMTISTLFTNLSGNLKIRDDFAKVLLPRFLRALRKESGPNYQKVIGIFDSSHDYHNQYLVDFLTQQIERGGVRRQLTLLQLMLKGKK